MSINPVYKAFKFIDTKLTDNVFINEHRASDCDFTRKRCLDFKSLFWLICSSTKKSLQYESGMVSERFDNKIPDFSPQAFSKARLKMKSDAFKSIFKESTRIICQNIEPQSFKGYRVLAVDGTKMLLPDTHENREGFGIGGNKINQTAMAGASIFYDTLNDIILDAELTSVNAAERDTLKLLLNRTDETFTGSSKIITLDRGYPSRDIFHFLQERNYKYVIRMTLAYNTPKSIREAKAPDSVVIDSRDTTLMHRVIKVQLITGEEELLITNIFDDNFTVEDFDQLYQMRWSVETKYNEIKHKYTIEKFTGIRKNSIEQDFYSTVFLSNITSLIKQAGELLERKTNKKKASKHKYQINHSTVIGLFLQQLPKIFIYQKRRIKILEKLLDTIKTKRSAIRNNRHVERKKKHASRKYSMNQK